MGLFATASLPSTQPLWKLQTQHGRSLAYDWGILNKLILCWLQSLPRCWISNTTNPISGDCPLGKVHRKSGKNDKKHLGGQGPLSNWYVWNGGCGLRREAAHQGCGITKQKKNYWVLVFAFLVPQHLCAHNLAPHMHYSNLRSSGKQELRKTV